MTSVLSWLFWKAKQNLMMWNFNSYTGAFISSHISLQLLLVKATGKSLKVMTVFYTVLLSVAFNEKQNISQFLLKQAIQNNPKVKVEGI